MSENTLIEKSLEQRVGELLIQWGIAPSLKGFHCIIDAVCLWDGQKGAIEIYWDVADKQGEKRQRQPTCHSHWEQKDIYERAIRTAFSKLDMSKKKSESILETSKERIMK